MFSPHARRFRPINANGVELLSLREKQVVTALAEGLTNREIAERLSLSPHTVKNYLFRIFDKLGVSSRSELLSLTLANHVTPHENPRVEAKDCSICRAGVLRWMQNAAEEGFVVAQCALAHLYRVGQGVPRDLGLAYQWHLISEASCASLPDEILTARREVAALLEPEQLRSAERAANLWLDAPHSRSRQKTAVGGGMY
jgi:DNA-binding CsgD family transcriptional regulator